MAERDPPCLSQKKKNRWKKQRRIMTTKKIASLTADTSR